MRNNGSTNNAAAAAQEAIAQARRAALEAAAARRRAEQAEQQARVAEQQAQQAQPAGAAPAADASATDGQALLAGQAAVTGAVPLPPPPGVGSPELMAEFGMGGTAEAAAYMADLRGRLEGAPPVAAGAVTSTMLDPSGFYQAAGTLKGTEAMAGSEADIRAVADKTTVDHLARQLSDDPNLTHYPPETVRQLASFRDVPNAHLQQALDHALKFTFASNDLKPEQLSKEMAYMAHQSADPAVKQALETKVKAWADDALKQSLDGKEKEDGAKKGLSEFQDKMVALAKQTGLGDVVQNAAQQAVKDGHKEIEDTTKRGRSLWDKITGAVSGLVDGAFHALGEGIKKAIGAVGDVANFVVDKVGDVAEAGLDVAAAGLDAVGAHGVADGARQAGHAVNEAYDFVGHQVGGFTHGVGDALGDTVEGVGSVIAHPVATVQAVGHLVTHPGDIPKVATALWDQAKQGGVAHAIGYIAGNLAPALLTGGSAEGASLGARLGAVAGESRALTFASAAIKGSRAAELAANVGGKVGDVASAAGKGLRYVRELAGKPVQFVGESRFGRLVADAGQGEKIQAIAGRFRQARQVLGEQPTLSRVRTAIQSRAEAFERFKYGLNSKIDQGVAKGLRAFDGTATGEAVGGKLSARLSEDALGQAEAKVAFRRAVGSDRARPFGERYDRIVEQEIEANTRVPSGIQQQIDQSSEALVSGKPGKGAAEYKDFLQAEDHYEYLSRERPEVLKQAIDGAYRHAGLDPAEVERFVHDYTTSSSKTNPEVFNRIKANTEHVLGGHEPVNAEQRLIKNLMETRGDRARYISQVTGMPVPDSYRVFRGTSREDTLQRVAKAWRDGDSTVQVANRDGVLSTSLDPSVGADFGLGGSRWEGTVGQGAARPDGNFTVFDFDAPQHQVLFDKYLDGGASAFGPAEQRAQREVLLAARGEDLHVPAERAKISYNGRTYTYAERDELLKALEQAGVVL